MSWACLSFAWKRNAPAHRQEQQSAAEVREQIVHRVRVVAVSPAGKCDREFAKLLAGAEAEHDEDHHHPSEAAGAHARAAAYLLDGQASNAGTEDMHVTVVAKTEIGVAIE